jgi:hypothetical protein
MIGRMPGLLSFPNPVNEKAARSVAAGVLALAVLTLATQWLWLTVPLAAGFWLRVASGPRFSPLGQLATRVIAPRLGPAKLVPGPPKRFAQSIGAVFTTAAAVAYLGFGSALIANVLVAFIVVAAGLESIFAVCLGCIAFGWLMRAGVIAPDTCEACNNVGARLQTAT